jgi:hypothetical protein
LTVTRAASAPRFSALSDGDVLQREPAAQQLSTSEGAVRVALHRGLAAANQHDAPHDVVALIEASDAEARLLAGGRSSPCSNDPVFSTANDMSRSTPAT